MAGTMQKTNIMEAKNLIDGKACSMAKVTKETEKAYQLSYVAEIYGEQFTIKGQWFAKSQIEVKKVEGDTIWFVPKNDWILDANTKKYAQYIAATFANVKSEIKTYLSRMNNEKITIVYC